MELLFVETVGLRCTSNSDYLLLFTAESFGVRLTKLLDRSQRNNMAIGKGHLSSLKLRKMKGIFPAG